MLSEYFHRFSRIVYLKYKWFPPHLHYIVLGDRADDPGFSWVPREVRDLGGVTAVDEEQLGRSVFCVLSVLLLPNLGKVPHVQAAICPGARQDGLIVGRPLHLEDLVLVRFPM